MNSNGFTDTLSTSYSQNVKKQMINSNVFTGILSTSYSQIPKQLLVIDNGFSTREKEEKHSKKENLYFLKINSYSKCDDLLKLLELRIKEFHNGKY